MCSSDLLTAFLAIYSFVSTTIVFYVLASQKQSIDAAFQSIFGEQQDRSREIENVYRYIDGENEKVARRIDAESSDIYSQLDRLARDIECSKTDECCKTTA